MRVSLLISDLIDKHEGDYLQCKGCPSCKQIKQLTHERPPEEKYKHILAKGQEMTKSDIAFLLKKDVKKKSIRKALNMHKVGFQELMTNFGFIQRRVEEVAKILEQEYRDLKAKGLKDKEIAERKGLAASYLSTLKKNWKGTENPTPKKFTPQIKDTSASEYNKIIEELRVKLDNKDGALLKLNEKMADIAKEHREEIADMHLACDDVEKELATVRKERDNYLNQLLDTRHKYHNMDYTVENQKKALIDTRKTLERYEKENKALRQLVGLWASE
jgi:hypothetical protein